MCGILSRPEYPVLNLVDQAVNRLLPDQNLVLFRVQHKRPLVQAPVENFLHLLASAIAKWHNIVSRAGTAAVRHEFEWHGSGVHPRSAPSPLPPSPSVASLCRLPPSIPPSIPPVSLTHFHSVGIRGSGQGARGAHSCPLSDLVRGLHDENIVVVWELVWKVLTGVCISTLSPSKTTVDHAARHTRNVTLALLVVAVVLLLTAHESGRCSRERSPLSDRAKLPPRWTDRTRLSGASNRICLRQCEGFLPNSRAKAKQCRSQG